ncbi:hypothetical protein CCM_03492 [Cordyceps militaris CM01]|uniref:Kinase-like domain n=1 Tax=Cordyceps militaris (strain CM01) TaxID=983644 RepID=G3JB08_CORMM|nr:uncharacterized protein CCM_03492 [Cordyceps militaris CM01]EGX95220.1 hypothetical protein CCM_03492 [Cordyceps militaris CM01]
MTMENNPDSTRVPYREQRVTYSNSSDEVPFMSLSLRLHGHTFRLCFSAARFHQSPARLAEFHAFHASRSSGSSSRPWNEMFDWALAPLLPRLDELAPPPAAAVAARPTLQDYVAGPDYRCQLGAVDDVLVVESVEALDHVQKFWHHAAPSERQRSLLRKDLIRTVAPADVAILPAGAPAALDTPCSLVSVGGQEFCFDSLDEVCVPQLMAAYEKIAVAGLPPHVHVRRLEAVVFDEHGNVPLGSLYSNRFKELPLAYEKHCRDSVSLSTKRRWISQLREAVAALHAIGIVWGAVSAFNVYIDKEDDLWIGGFGGGWSDDWVDEDKVDEPEGDLQALEALVNWIMEPNDGGVPSKL